MARSGSDPIAKASAENSKVSTDTIVAATALVASAPSPVATRSGVCTSNRVAAARRKGKALATEWIPRVPPTRSRPVGRWIPKKVRRQSVPDTEDTEEQEKLDFPQPHHALRAYWGDIDKPRGIYLFDHPSPEYVPIVLPHGTTFEDNEDVSFYLMNYVLCFIK